MAEMTEAEERALRMWAIEQSVQVSKGRDYYTEQVLRIAHIFTLYVKTGVAPK
jgi:hypothetical protein